MIRPNIHLRRTAPTIGATWDKVVTNLQTNAPLAAYSRPGGFNDPDMLEVGNGALTEGENRAHFSVSSVMGAPLLAVMTHQHDLVDIEHPDQHRGHLAGSDLLGLQGAVVRTEGDIEVYAKPLASCGARGVVVFNKGTTASEITLKWSDIWLSPGAATVRDLWSHAARDSASDSLKISVDSHDAVALKIVGSEVLRPRGDAYLSDVPFTYATNGYGPVERDTSNGELPAGDGRTLKIRGQSYKKGLGVHAPSLIRYRLGRKCTQFTADIGVDDREPRERLGHLRGVGRWREDLPNRCAVSAPDAGDSSVLTGTSPAKHIVVDVSNRRELRLLVTTGERRLWRLRGLGRCARSLRAVAGINTRASPRLADRQRDARVTETRGPPPLRVTRRRAVRVDGGEIEAVALAARRGARARVGDHRGVVGAAREGRHEEREPALGARVGHARRAEPRLAATPPAMTTRVETLERGGAHASCDQRLDHRALEGGAEIGDVGLGRRLCRARRRGARPRLDAREAELERVARAPWAADIAGRARRRRVAGEAVDDGAARVAEAEELGDLVEGLAGGVVARRAELADVGERGPVDAVDRGVAARGEQAPRTGTRGRHRWAPSRGRRRNTASRWPTR